MEDKDGFAGREEEQNASPVAEPGSRGDQVYTASDSDEAFTGSASPEGSGYTTPNGGHGYVYAPDPGEEGRRSFSERRLIISVCAVVGILLLMGVCILGTYAALRQAWGITGRDPGQTERATDRGSLSGIQIVTGPDDLLETPAPEGLVTVPERIPLDPETLAETLDLPEDTGAVSPEPLPGTVTVHKKQPLRRDTNGDGQPDIELDAAGNVLTSAGDGVLPTATVVYRIADSVVEISTETVVQSGKVGQYVTSGAGSGVIISTEGFIVTNHHVIDGADSITVRLKNGRTYEGHLVGADELTDIAVVWIDAGDAPLTVATLGCSYDLVVGEQVLAIGNPLGSLGGTVTNGIISATERLIRIEDVDMKLLQISAPISPGNSGGGLFNLAGDLVGVVNAKCSEGSVEGLGFAIPVDTAYDVILELIDHGYVKGRPESGLTFVDVTSSATAMYYFHIRATGVFIYDSAFTEELKYGDLVLTVNGREVSKASDIRTLINRHAVGDVLQFVIQRGQQQLTVSLTLRERVPAARTDAG